MKKKYKQSLSHFLPRDPRNIDIHNWFYIEPKGLLLIHQAVNARGEMIVDEVPISWAKIEKALKDFRAAQQKQNYS